MKSPEEVANEAVELREEGGFQGLKLRLGRERLGGDLATIEAVREAVGRRNELRRRQPDVTSLPVISGMDRPD